MVMVWGEGVGEDEGDGVGNSVGEGVSEELMVVPRGTTVM